jgi:ribosomal protein L25 (general stress protein Ctc)
MRRSAFRQSDLTKALKAAKAAGSEVARVEIAPDGRMVVVMTKDVQAHMATGEAEQHREWQRMSKEPISK